MIRTNQHRHNLDTRAHETLQPQRTQPARQFEDWLRRREDEGQAQAHQGEPSAETLAVAHAGLPELHAAAAEQAVARAGLDTPTPASAATAQAHLRMSLPLAPQQHVWTFDLSGANLPVQTVTLSRASNGQLHLNIQSSGGASGQQVESHLPKLRQRLADKVAHVGLQDSEGLELSDDGSIDP